MVPTAPSRPSHVGWGVGVLNLLGTPKPQNHSLVLPLADPSLVSQWSLSGPPIACHGTKAL